MSQIALTILLLSLCGLQSIHSAIYKMPIEQSDFFTVEPIENGPSMNLGEGPYWDPDSKVIFYVDAFVGDLHRFDTETKVNTKRSTGILNSIIIPIAGKPNWFVTTQKRELVKYNWETETMEIIDSAGPGERFNDAKVDSEGRLWIGSIKNDKDNKLVPYGGKLYKLVGKKLVIMSPNYTISNGMAWNKNNTLMFFNDSEDQKTFAFDFNSTDGTISNKRLLVDYAKNSDYSGEYPDGMAIDQNDEIWIALYNGSRIVRISPEGQLLASIKVPAIQTTSLTFAGPNLDTLYVTCGNETTDKVGQPNAGKLFRVKQKPDTIPNDDPQIVGTPSRPLKME